ncbi:alpha/beta fold hydrolase [Agrobacterium sp. NPDC058088]|uniref:alpha/beta fold hydrolase n=1 Tax=Agrobacterium sp. NPDC058088 TaxID=3346335 RepID=UPI0036DDB9FD
MTRRTVSTISAIASAVTLAATLSANAADNTIPNDQSVRNVVLVHGAFADGSGWKGVYDNLTKRGYRVTVVQNPLTSLADDVAATKRALERQDGPVILVGHSWGGTVITEAGVDDKVKGLVYVSALSPDAGETTAQQYDGFAPASDFVIETTKDGFDYVSPAKFKAGFAHDVSEADVAFMRDAQVPINMSAFGTKLENAAWRTRPSWAVIATEDKAFDQAMLIHMAERIKAKITKVSASHALFMTQPEVISDTIDLAARTVSAKK